MNRNPANSMAIRQTSFDSIGFPNAKYAEKVRFGPGCYEGCCDEIFESQNSQDRGLGSKVDRSCRRGPVRRTSARPLGFRPIPSKLFGATDDAVDRIMGSLPRTLGGCGVAGGRDLQNLQLFEDRHHRASRVAEKLRAADAGEDPTHAFKHGLPVHVFGELFERVIAVSVALDGQAFTVAFDDQIDSKGSKLPVRGDLIPRRRETFHDFSFEVRLRALFLLV